MKKRLIDRLTVEFRTESGSRNWNYLYGFWKGSRWALPKSHRKAIEPCKDGEGKAIVFYYTYPRRWLSRIVSGMPDAMEYPEFVHYCQVKYAGCNPYQKRVQEEA